MQESRFSEIKLVPRHSGMESVPLTLAWVNPAAFLAGVIFLETVRLIQLSWPFATCFLSCRRFGSSVKKRPLVCQVSLQNLFFSSSNDHASTSMHRNGSFTGPTFLGLYNFSTEKCIYNFNSEASCSIYLLPLATVTSLPSIATSQSQFKTQF